MALAPVTRGVHTSRSSWQNRIEARKAATEPTIAGKPFTVAHFRAWALTLTLDNGKSWKIEPFQARFLEDVFAGIPEAWLMLPEGNGKTTLIAGLALYHCQYRRGAYVPVAAASRDQAQIVYAQAEGFVIRTDWLQPVFRCLEGYRRIDCDGMGSRIQVLAAQDRTGDGVIPTLCIVDELHRHRDLKLYQTWRGKLEKRAGQLVAISTAGEPGSEFEKTREEIRRSATKTERTDTYVRAVSRQLILHQYAVPEKGDVEDMAVVKAANPFSGITSPMLKRKRASPTMTREHWQRFVCNLPTRSGRSAITEDEWHSAETSERIPPGQAIWLGMDVGWKWDTTAMVPLWIRDKDFRLFGPATVLRPPRDGNSLDPNLVERALLDIHERNPIETVVMDPTRAEQLAEWVRSEIGAEVIERDTGNASAALDYESFMEALRSGWLKHSGDVEFARHALNAIARVLPDGRAKFERPMQVWGRGGDNLQDARVIDALVAAAMVHATAAADLAQPASVYEERGVLTL